MISFEKNKNLYLFNSEEDISRSLNYAKNIPRSNFSEDVIFNFYWRVPKDFTRKHVLPIKSSIVSQNIKNTKFMLWSNIDLSKNELVKPLLPFIETKIWDLKEEIKGSPLENSNIINGVVDDPLCYLGGDLFRLLCLYKYGGVYIDMDVVVLRDFDPILPYEFVYQWGSSGTHNGEPELAQNGAVMRLKKNSNLSLSMLEEILNTPPNPNTTCWGKDLYFKVKQKNNDLNVFPCAWFNTEWGMGRTIQPFRKNYEGNISSELFDGAFTWHWHNKWDENIEEGSKFQILENIVEKKFKEMSK